ncbi:MAG: EAL domain-containing protein [Gammaproteobacteria bacterium]|nr:EAL domain-containing protein [Gammaproteobacteria bacterium]MDH5728921.1 EAL domain-containing protein [Gammaproteobacteria bacterium]
MHHDIINLLLLEDNPADERLVREMLAEWGDSRFKLTHVKTLSQAISSLNSLDIDVCLMDLNLPDSQGLGALSEIITIAPQLPIVVLSGQADEDLAFEAVQKGAQDYIVKGQGDGVLLIRALRYAIERKRTERRLAYLAEYDPLTDLPNRTLFKRRLNRALTRADRNNSIIGLLFLDLDHFKDINDTLGHDAGDELLIIAGARIQTCVRKGDTIARLGGDEFTVILENVGNKKKAAKVAQKIIDCLSEPLEVAGQEVYITTSIGIACYPDNCDNAEDLIKHADMALYAAKAKGRSGYEYYRKKMKIAVSQRMNMVNRLRKAIESDELELYYQPQFNIANGSLIGTEALLRWHHPRMGLLAPDQFIHLLEETGLIIPVGEWVLNKACLQNQAWMDSGYGQLRVSVNLSTRQFKQNELVNTISRVLEASHMDPTCLHLEVTESLLMENIDCATKIIQKLAETGVNLSLDDFGTGYSSLSYLKTIPVTALKVDRSFIQDVCNDSDGAAMVAAIIRLAHSLRLKVVAEGVEEKNQLVFLAAQGCDEAQGFLFNTPMSATDMTQWLHQQYSSEDLRKTIN